MTNQRLQAAQRLLIIGGARSGKSTLAERVLAQEAAVDYVATSAAGSGDAEWESRIADHRRRRPEQWHTVESLDLVTLLSADGPPLLIDCLTVWLTRVMDGHGAWNDDEWARAEPLILAEIDALAEAVRTTSRRVIVVTNEVGQGVVPASASVRRFRDQMGWANQRIAASVDEVAWAVAGRYVLMEEWS